MKNLQDKIICGNCIDVLGGTRKRFADLIFADPPFNIGYKYDNYNDSVQRDVYVGWTHHWMAICKKVLKPTGSFYIAISDEYVADVKKIADKLELYLRNWIIWHYTFGQQMQNKFARSHTHILYFVKNKTKFTFNDPVVRVNSDRQEKYNDKRANPAGKLPDDVWSDYPRVCGTFKEREGWHPCQMPESLLARIIRASSNEDDRILDPFSGSGTTAVVAAKLCRHFTGIEISDEYVQKSEKRVSDNKDLPIEGEGKGTWDKQLEKKLKNLYHENKFTTEQLGKDRVSLVSFTGEFNQRVGESQNLFQTNQVFDRLVKMRKSGRLGSLRKKS